MTSQDTAVAQPKPLKRVALTGLGNKLADTRLAPEGEMDPLIWLVAAHGGAGARARTPESGHGDLIKMR